MKWLYWLVYRGFGENQGPWVLVKICETAEEAYSYVEKQGDFKLFFKIESFEN